MNFNLRLASLALQELKFLMHLNSKRVRLKVKRHKIILKMRILLQDLNWNFINYLVLKTNLYFS